jgi:hypothetical protein
MFEIIVKQGGREVGSFEVGISGTPAEREEQVLEAGRRLGRMLLEPSLAEVADQSPVPRCCGRAMSCRDRRGITLKTMTGEVPLVRHRYRCERCRHAVYQGDAAIRCGRHRVTLPLAKRVCQLAETEHYTRLPQLLADQHGVRMDHQEINELVRAVGGHAEERRRAEAAAWQRIPADRRAWPDPLVMPERIYVSVDGVMYCTNETEPDPYQPGRRRLVWQQMRVGCVFWQTAEDRWDKRVVWGRESAEDFGASLCRLAWQCGWHEAREKLFGADGADWCWAIHERYFSQAAGILDWYHASEHVWQAAHLVAREEPAAHEWAHEALDHLRSAGGQGLEAWLVAQRLVLRGTRRLAVEKLLAYVRPRLERMNYPRFRAHGWQVGTGMIESTGKQLVGLRLKGPGMHWTEAGALAITALRAIDLNGQWHSHWKTLTLST